MKAQCADGQSRWLIVSRTSQSRRGRIQSRNFWPRYVVDEPKKRHASGSGRRLYTAEYARSPGAINKKDERTKEGRDSKDIEGRDATRTNCD